MGWDGLCTCFFFNISRQSLDIIPLLYYKHSYIMSGILRDKTMFV